jgi:hypothetical protein
VSRLRLLPFIIATLAIFAPVNVGASSTPGLLVTVYNNYGYNGSPPLPTESGRPVIGTTTATRIQQNFDQAPLFNMYEDFIVKYWCLGPLLLSRNPS